MKELKNIDVPFYRYDLCVGFKDANEALQKNREDFAISVAEAEHMQEKEMQEYFKEFSRHFESSRLQNFVDGITDSVNTLYISTGFRLLDEVLDGGVQEEQLPVFLLVESLVFIGNLFEDNFKFSDLVCEKLKMQGMI